MRKGLSPVVAVALLLVVSIVSVISIQTWYSSFQTELFVNVEQKINLGDEIKIYDIIGGELLVNVLVDNLYVSEIQVNGETCITINNIASKGFDSIPIMSCIQDFKNEVITLNIITENSVLVHNEFLGSDSLLSSCYSPTNINTTGIESPCEGMLIVNRTMLDNAIFNYNISNGLDFYIPFSGINYTFNDSQHNIFTGQVGNLNGLFFGQVNFNVNINYWDVSNVVFMDFMFFDATSFNQPLNNWDVSNVEFMGNMFNFATSFNQSLNNWDVSNVQFMDFMFNFATSFNQPLNNWDISNVIDMGLMFSDATSFNQNISMWDTSSIMSCISFNSQSSPSWTVDKQPSFPVIC